jgi:RNA 3'-phosphate cyclase
MIEIDGSHGEGGGQIIRTAISMSAITGKPIRIFNIRANRQPCGLKAQHLTSINAAARLCDAYVTGNKIGSKELVFKPSVIKHGKFKFDIGTAGSISLVLQTLLPLAAFAKDCCTFEVLGGTDVWHSPTIDYFVHVFCDYMQQIGFKVHTDIISRGFYPKGGGAARVVAQPWKEKIPYVHTSQGTFHRNDIFSIASEELSKKNVAERQVKGFGELLKYNEEKVEYWKTPSLGTSFHAHAHLSNCKLGACVVGELGKKAEDVGREAAEKLKKEIDSKATVDERMADQILIYLAFCGGAFRTSRITEHLKTNISVIEQFLGKKFEISEREKIVKVI